MSWSELRVTFGLVRSHCKTTCLVWSFAETTSVLMTGKWPVLAKAWDKHDTGANIRLESLRTSGLVSTTPSLKRYERWRDVIKCIYRVKNCDRFEEKRSNHIISDHKSLSLKLFIGRPASCYRKVAGSTPLVCISKCLWTRYWTPNCSWWARWHLAWPPPPSTYECVNYCKLLWTKKLHNYHLDNWQQQPTHKSNNIW